NLDRPGLVQPEPDLRALGEWAGRDAEAARFGQRIWMRRPRRTGGGGDELQRGHRLRDAIAVQVCYQDHFLYSEWLQATQHGLEIQIHDLMCTHVQRPGDRSTRGQPVQAYDRVRRVQVGRTADQLVV